MLTPILRTQIRPALRRALGVDEALATPRDIFAGDLAWWHKTYEADSLTVVDGKASSLKDYSGNGYDFTQLDVPSRPAILANGINGKTCLNFSPDIAFGANIGRGPSPVSADQPFYLATVVKPRTNAALAQNRMIVWLHNSPGIQGLAMRQDDPGVCMLYEYASGAGGAGVVVAIDAVHVTIGYFNGPNSWIEIDGVRSALTDVGSQGMGPPGNDYVCYGVGGGFGANDTADALFAEGALIVGDQSEEDIIKLRKYLQHVAGI